MAKRPFVALPTVTNLMHPKSKQLLLQAALCILNAPDSQIDFEIRENVTKAFFAFAGTKSSDGRGPGSSNCDAASLDTELAAKQAYNRVNIEGNKGLKRAEEAEERVESMRLEINDLQKKLHAAQAGEVYVYQQLLQVRKDAKAMRDSLHACTAEVARIRNDVDAALKTSSCVLDSAQRSASTTERGLTTVQENHSDENWDVQTGECQRSSESNLWLKDKAAWKLKAERVRLEQSPGFQKDSIPPPGLSTPMCTNLGSTLPRETKSGLSWLEFSNFHPAEMVVAAQPMDPTFQPWFVIPAPTTPYGKFRTLPELLEVLYSFTKGGAQVSSDLSLFALHRLTKHLTRTESTRTHLLSSLLTLLAANLVHTHTPHFLKLVTAFSLWQVAHILQVRWKDKSLGASVEPTLLLDSWETQAHFQSLIDGVQKARSDDELRSICTKYGSISEGGTVGMIYSFDSDIGVRVEILPGRPVTLETVELKLAARDPMNIGDLY